VFNRLADRPSVSFLKVLVFSGSPGEGLAGAPEAAGAFLASLAAESGSEDAGGVDRDAP